MFGARSTTVARTQGRSVYMSFFFSPRSRVFLLRNGRSRSVPWPVFQLQLSQLLYRISPGLFKEAENFRELAFLGHTEGAVRLQCFRCPILAAEVDILHHVGRRDVYAIIRSDKVEGVTKRCLDLIVRDAREVRCSIDDFPWEGCKYFKRCSRAPCDTSIESKILT